jgi:hypothetical protein
LYRLLEREAESEARALVSIQRRRIEAEHAARVERVDALLSHLQAAADANTALLAKANSDQLQAKQLFADVKPLLKELLGVAKAWKEVEWRHEPAAPPPAPVPASPDAVPPTPEGDS